MIPKEALEKGKSIDRNIGQNKLKENNQPPKYKFMLLHPNSLDLIRLSTSSQKITRLELPRTDLPK